MINVVSDMERLEISQDLILKFIKLTCAKADELNIDRDDLMRYASAMFNAMAEISTFQKFEVID